MGFKIECEECNEVWYDANYIPYTWTCPSCGIEYCEECPQYKEAHKCPICDCEVCSECYPCCEEDEEENKKEDVVEAVISDKEDRK